MSNAYTGLVLLFSSRGAVNTMAKLHAAGCSVVKGAPRHVQVISEDVEDSVLDLEDREFKVTRCKCCKGVCS